jgi:hypothetical protein
MPTTDTASSPSTSDSALMSVIRRVESNDEISALRFEPAVFSGLSMYSTEKSLIDRIAAANNCSFNTARVIFSSSFGLYQLMGFNIYSVGYKGTILDFWNSAPWQDQIFTAFLNANRINVSWVALKQDRAKLLAFARIYNGPGDPTAYANAMAQAAREIGI